MRYFEDSLLSLVLVWSTIGGGGGSTFAQLLDCDPCIERGSYKIHAVYPEGLETIEKAAVQSGLDLGVELTTYVVPVEEMASKISSLLSQSPHALIVSLPDNNEDVKQVVEQAISQKIPVFGYHAGYDSFQSMGGLGWVAQDELLAGNVVAEELFSMDGGILNVTENSTVVYIDPGNLPEARYEGLTQGLAAYNITPDYFEQNSTSLPLQKLCPDALVYGGADAIDTFPATFFSVEFCPNTVRVSLEESPEIWQLMEDGVVQMAISQQEYLQGALPVLMAALYATTGHAPSLPIDNDYGVFLSGPKVLKEAPSQEAQSCILDAFPVCPSTGENGCPCLDREKLKIGGVLHGVTTDTFWNPVFAAALQSAQDMGVTLEMDRLDPIDPNVLHLRMNAKIETLCSGSNQVDALFVTIPSELVLPGIAQCQENGIPVIAINAGAQAVKDMGSMHYIGQLEYNAGYGAAIELIKRGATKVWCLNHSPDTGTTLERCQGVEDAVGTDPTVEFVSQVIVPSDNDAKYVVDVKAAVDDDDGDWQGYGFVLVGPVQVPPGVSLLENHPEALMGSFDLSEDIFTALQNDELIYGIDQQPFLQGYLPIPLLTYFVQTQQRLLNGVVESGPSFVFEAPSKEQVQCEANFNQVCGGALDDAPTAAPASENDQPSMPTGEGPGSSGAMFLGPAVLVPCLLAMASLVWCLA